MNQKELREIRRRIRPEHNSITHLYGCYVNGAKEIISTLDECPVIDCFVTLPARESAIGKAGGFFSQTSIRYVLDTLYGTIYAIDLENNQQHKDRIEAAWQV